VSAAELLASVVGELAAIQELVERGRAAWEADEMLRVGIERRWITAGNCPERYRIAVGLGAAVDPWAELYEYRCLLAPAIPEALDSERIGHDTISDVGRLLQAVERQQTGDFR